MAWRHPPHGYEDASGNYRNDVNYLTGTPQDFLFETPYNYCLPDEEDIYQNAQAVDLSKRVDYHQPYNKPVDLSLRTEQEAQFHQQDQRQVDLKRKCPTEEDMVTSSLNHTGADLHEPHTKMWTPSANNDLAEAMETIQIKREVVDPLAELGDDVTMLDTIPSPIARNMDMELSPSYSPQSQSFQSSPNPQSISPNPSIRSNPDGQDGAIDAMNAMVKAQQKRRKKNVSSSGSGGAKVLDEELCLICGDRASGFHYNALSCEGCKGFFRRSITRGASYKCKNGGNCEMDMWMRRRCQFCRLKRCREVGMKEECLLSEDQCKARDVRRKARQSLVRKSIDTYQAPDSSNTPETKKSPKAQVQVKLSDNPLAELPDNERELIEKLVMLQDKYELPDEQQIASLADVKIREPDIPTDLSDALYKQMANVTIMVTQLVVEFAKHLPGFMTLDRDDQIVLLKGSSCEIMMIRTARRYDLETDTIVFADGMPHTRENMRFAGLDDYVDSMFHYCRNMGRLAVDNAEYGLLTALTIFSIRPGLKDIRRIEEIQEMYARVLEAYDKHRRGPGTFYAKLLVSLVELRTLSCEYAHVLFNLKVEKGSLPPLLCEYFDVVE